MRLICRLHQAPEPIGYRPFVTGMSSWQAVFTRPCASHGCLLSMMQSWRSSHSAGCAQDFRIRSPGVCTVKSRWVSHNCNMFAHRKSKHLNADHIGLSYRGGTVMVKYFNHSSTIYGENLCEGVARMVEPKHYAASLFDTLMADRRRAMATPWLST